MHPDHGHSHAHPHGHARGADGPARPGAGTARALRIGIGGPVGSGKTALVAALCRALGKRVRLAVVTNDIYTTEDADFLRHAGVLDPSRIQAVQTGYGPGVTVMPLTGPAVLITALAGDALTLRRRLCLPASGTAPTQVRSAARG